MADLVEVLSGGVLWRMARPLQHQLLGSTGLRLAEWCKNGVAQVVKNGPHRTVYHVVLPQVDFYLKHYRLMNLRARLREWVRPPKARIEFDRAQAIVARGIPTVEALAWGEGQRPDGPNESFLIVRSLKDVVPVHDYFTDVLPQLEDSRRPGMRQRFARGLADFVSRLHNQGILHHDLHPGNILVRLVDDQPRFYLIDLHGVQVRPHLSLRQRQENLVLLNRWFSMAAGRSDRLRFWQDYCAACESSMHPGDRRMLALELEESTWKSNLRFWVRRDWRCLSSNRYFQPIRQPGIQGYAVRDLGQEVLQSFVTDPDSAFQTPGMKLLKDSPTSTVAELELTTGSSPRKVIYKRFPLAKWTDPFTALARPSPAKRSWFFGHGLLDRWLPTARPLLVMHKIRNGLPAEGYLLAEKIDGAMDLHQFCQSLSPGSSTAHQGVMPREESVRKLRQVIDKVAHLVRELHRRHYSNRDLKAPNILLTDTDTDTEPKAWLIDLVGLHRHQKLPEHRRLQNLTRLNASFHQHPLLTRTDRLRFLRTYFQWRLIGKGDWKVWWRKIEKETIRKASRNRQTGRPLA